MGDERKSSEDLLREARERLQGKAPDPDSTTPDKESDTAPSGPTAVESRQPVDDASTPPLDEPAVATPTETPGTRPGETKRRSRAWIAWLAIGLLALGSYIFNNIGGVDRADSGEIVGSGDLDVMSMQVGDCFNDPEGTEDVIFDVAAVPCSEPHDNEVFAIESVGEAFGEQFPGLADLELHSYDVCIGEVFDAYVGTPYRESDLDVFSLTPTEESWADGDREFVCALYRLDLAKLTDTARDSGL